MFHCREKPVPRAALIAAKAVSDFELLRPGERPAKRSRWLGILGLPLRIPTTNP